MEERLSKLQKWILIRCFEKGKCFIERQTLLKEYRQNGKPSLNSASAEVTFSKTLRNLRDKEYIELFDYRYTPLFSQEDIEGLGLGEIVDERLHKVKYISLTERGIKKAGETVLKT